MTPAAKKTFKTWFLMILGVLICAAIIQKVSTSTILIGTCGVLAIICFIIAGWIKAINKNWREPYD